MLKEMSRAVVGACRNLVAKVSTGTTAAGTSLMVVSGSALAQTDYDPISTAVDWTAVGGIIIGILASIAGVYVLWKGGAMAVSAIKRA